MSLKPKFEIYETKNSWILSIPDKTEGSNDIMKQWSKMVSKLGLSDNILDQVINQQEEEKKGPVGEFTFLTLKDLMGFLDMYFKGDKTDKKLV